ncbi:MAG: dienelactone hydrolase family protein [Planctomycetota bacterium]|nr:dienelactone hydrolase family protein [Planctomycetota bacterium]
MKRFRLSLLSWRSVLCLAALFACSESRELVAADALPGTKLLTLDKPLDEAMVEGIDKFALREIADGVAKRATYWNRDYASPEAYEKSVAPNRERLKVILGAVDKRPAPAGFQQIVVNRHLTGSNAPRFTATPIRWPALDGVYGEGLLLDPNGEAKARVICLPDADWSPEAFVGLVNGVPVPSQLGRRLAELGCQVVVPVLISREETYSGHPDVRYTNQPHREFIYRQAFEMGRHVIGYEVQKVLAAVDQFTLLNEQGKKLPIAVAGIGEGGLLALYSAALDTRIEGALVSGYFAPREGLWQEPIYRNVWARLREFGDADLASLIAPRGLVIEAASAPESAGPPAPKDGRSGGAAPGKIITPSVTDVTAEAGRAHPHFEKLKQATKFALVVPTPDGKSPPGSFEATTAFLKQLRVSSPEVQDLDAKLPTFDATGYDASLRMKRQVDQMVEYTQKLLRRSAKVRDTLWSKASRKSLEDWEKTAEEYRDMVYDELIGRLPKSDMALNPRTRQVLDEPGFVGYEVVLDVYPDVIAGGILLLPKGMKPGEKRPVVVCQHGLEGVPMDTISKTVDGFKYYSAFTAELANRGFITYAPQNPYRGQDRFRTLQRKSNPMKRSLFTYIIPQHERTIEFLKTLPNTDPKRIAFYGLSYGGKTAVRVPPMVKDYCLSICSADFNEWVVKNTTVHDGYSYVFTPEYEIFEWNMGHTANYAELSYLMTPRPFMVERGHDDGVAPDEWVAWEYSKVRRHYVKLGLGDKTEIEFFNGPHKINGVQTYEFLHKHLDWPRP